MHAACMWSWDAEVIMPWEGEAGTGRWHGGDAAWGQLAVRSLGPAPAGPCCASVPTGASPAPCSHTRPWQQLSTPGLALRGRAPQEPTRLQLCSCCPAQGELRVGALPAGPQPLAPLGAVLQGAHPVGKVSREHRAPTQPRPPAAPTRLPALTQLQEPALPVGVEEGVGEVVAIVLRDFEGFVLDALIEILAQGHTGSPLLPPLSPGTAPLCTPALSPSPAAAPRAGPPRR